ncbi:hypothetical protein AB08_2063 [Escherichia coli 5-366-08_S1_C1]|nr:hypothetical protein AB08_2063 [Escherichia coli 5-366-08_S1_C1]
MSLKSQSVKSVKGQNPCAMLRAGCGEGVEDVVPDENTQCGK